MANKVLHQGLLGTCEFQMPSIARSALAAIFGLPMIERDDRSCEMNFAWLSCRLWPKKLIEPPILSTESAVESRNLKRHGCYATNMCGALLPGKNTKQHKFLRTTFSE
jgi:hypothetical protein